MSVITGRWSDLRSDVSDVRFEKKGKTSGFSSVGLRVWVRGMTVRFALENPVNSLFLNTSRSARQTPAFAHSRDTSG